MKRLVLAVAFILLGPLSAKAANAVYISQNGGATTQDGLACTTAKPASYFNTIGNWSATPTGIQIGPNTTVHLCGTFTGTLGGGALLTFQGSGTSGNPITLLFETGANGSSPAWGAAGFINLAGKQWITINGGTNGLIQNTANGDQLANRQTGTFINATNVQHVNITALTLANSYVAVQNYPTPLGSPATDVNVITISGQNNRIYQNTIHDCSWCIKAFYGNGDTALEIDHNDVSRYNHYIAWAAPGANTTVSPSLVWHDDKIHDNINWESVVPALSTLSCTYHQDGLHAYSISGSSSTDGIYIYNNYFYGQNSACTTGFIFVEGGGSNARVVNGYMWNNVFDATGFDTITGLTAAGCTTTNPCGPLGGLIGVFSGSGSWTIINNTAFYKDAYTSGTQGYNIGSVNNLTFKNNVSNGFVAGNNLGSLTSTPAGQVNNNFYGSACILSNNCFIFNQSFKQSFANWVSASGFDASAGTHTSTYSGALLLSDGSPQSTSPVVNLGANLTSLCSGLLGSLCSSTTQGGNIGSPTARPGVGAWTAGAYQTASAGSPPGTPGTLSGSLSGSSNVILNWGASSGTVTSYAVKRATVSGGPYTTIAGTSALTYTDTNLAAATYYYVVSASNTFGSSANSNQVSVVVPPVVSVPGAPSNLTATPSGSTANLAWTASTGTPTGYKVNRGTSCSGPFSLIATLGLVTNYSDTGLANGGYCYVVNGFNSAGTSINSNTASVTIATASALTATPSVLSFPVVVLGTTSGALSTTINSTGTANLILAASSCITISGPNAADFAITASPACSSSFAPGATGTVSVTYTPSLVGNESASLVIVSNDPSSPDSVTLTGSGLAPVVISPTSLTFGNQNPHKSATPQTVTYQNNSGASITVTSVLLTTGTQFAISANTCVTTIANGAQCSFNVTFTPTSLTACGSNGICTDTVTITDSSVGSPRTVSLTGNVKKKGIIRVGGAVNWPYYGADLLRTVLRPYYREELLKTLGI